MKFFAEKPQTASKKKVLDIKTLLKLARQYIDDNNIKRAQQCCKKVLRKNNKNYLALVLLGKSYGKTYDASVSYEKAIELKPDHPLAWQGLANYYEGKEDDPAKIKLLSIYDKILTLNIEEDYADKTLKKLGQLGCLLKNNDTVSYLVQYVRIQDSAILIKTAKTQILQLLQSEVSCKNEDIPDVINILQNFNDDDFSDDYSELILLGRLMLQNNDFMSAVKDIITLELFPKSLVMKEWLCKLLCETFIRQNSFHGFDIDKYINQLVTGVEDTKYGSILIAITFYYKRNMFEVAYQKCYSIIKDDFDIVEEIDVLFLLNCSKKTSNRIRTKNICNYFLKKGHLTNPDFILRMNTILLSCYVEEKDFTKSIYYLKKIPIDRMDSIVLTDFGYLYLQLDIINDVTREMLNSIEDYLDLFKIFDLLKNKKYSEAINNLLVYDKHTLKYYYLGLAYWFLNLNNESFENFQKAAELIPNHPTVHYCLGVHYYHRKDDIEESKKCLEKSYVLCKNDIKVVKLLSITYVKQNLMDLEVELLQSAFEVPRTRTFWVCTRLGRISYHRGIMDEALTCFLSARNIHPHDVSVHEFLGDIYFNKKEYDQALIAYNRVVQLSVNNVVILRCLNRIGCIFSERTRYSKAIYIFDNILDNDPSNITALKGVIENRIIFALKHIARDLFQGAREQMQYAVNRITTAMLISIKDLVYWILYADVLVFMTRLPYEYSFVDLQNSEGEVRKEKIDMYKCAIESYSNVIKFRDSGALFKCALTYFEYYCETNDSILCKTSYNLAVLYMKVNPNVWLIWDLLGKICYHLDKRETAYYCFSKALTLCEDSDFKVWCDLGLFYLKLDKQQLMSYQHVIERFDSSTFGPAWVKEELSGTFLYYNEDSEISEVDLSNAEDVNKFEFTQWIRSFNSSSNQNNEPTFDSPIESFNIVPNSTEIIEWYLSFEEETTWSCYSLGNIQEKKGLFVPALRYYDKAYAIADDKLKNKMLSHKGRVLMKMNEYEEAVNVYNEIREKNLHDMCTFAFALYKMKNYKKSFTSYDKALNDLCENDDQRINVLVSMSNVAYRLKGLRAGAMLLLRAVKMKCGEGDNFNLPFLKSYIFKKVEIQLVAHVMTDYLYKDIDKTIWWYYVGLNYFRATTKNAKLTRACIKRALRENTVTQRNGKLYALYCVAEYYTGNRQRALYLATRALKVYPVQPELWAIFILCIYTDKTGKGRFLRVIIETARKFVKISQPMDKWLTKIEEEMDGKSKKFHFTFASNSILP